MKHSPDYEISTTVDLTRLIVAYQQGELSRDEIMHHLYCICYTQPMKMGLIKEEDAAEFLIFFLPTIEGMLVNYRFTGIPFSNYLTSSLRSKIRSFNLEKYRSAYHENVANYAYHAQTVTEDFQQEVCEESSPEYTVSTKIGRKQLITIRQTSGEAELNVDHHRLLYLLLICFHDIPGDRRDVLQRIYDSYDIDLFDLLERIDSICRKKYESHTALEEKKNRIFTQVLLLETQIQREVDPEMIDRLKTNLDKQQKRLEAVLERLKHSTLQPSHRQIAEVLDIPKGSIDSGIYYLKKNLKMLLDDR